MDVSWFRKWFVLIVWRFYLGLNIESMHHDDDDDDDRELWLLRDIDWIE